MRKFFTTLKSVVATAVIASMTLAASCSYDDSAIKDNLNKVQQEVDKVEKDLAALTERVAALEDQLAQEVDALKSLINGKTVVTNVETANGVTTVTLSDGTTFNVYPECGVVDTDTDTNTYLSIREDNGVLYWAVYEMGEFKEWFLVDGEKVAVYDGNEDDDVCDNPYQPEEPIAPQFRVNTETMKIEVSIDGGNTWVESGLDASSTGAQLFTGVKDNGDGTVTFTLGDGSELNVTKAELIEFNSARAQVYVKAGEVKDVFFTINDAVADINVMNQPLGWKAEVALAPVDEEDENNAEVLAAGGTEYVLKVSAPSKDFVKSGYAEKHGFIQVHFNTEAGACKVAKLAVDLAEITLDVDKAGNITIENTWVDTYMQQDWWTGETTEVTGFNNYYVGVMPLLDYSGDWMADLDNSVDMIAGYLNNLGYYFENYVEPVFEEGVCEKHVFQATVEDFVNSSMNYYDIAFEGESFLVFVIPCDMNNNGEFMMDEALFAEFKQLSVKVDVAESVWNNVYFDVTMLGGSEYGVYPVAKSTALLYYDSAEAYYGAMLSDVLAHPEWYDFGYTVTKDVVDSHIALNDLIGGYFELYPATEYYLAIFAKEDGREDYTAEDLVILEFATADLVEAETPAEYTLVEGENFGYFQLHMMLTVPETTAAVFSKWYDPTDEVFETEETLKASLIADGYYKYEWDYTGYTYDLSINVDVPGTTKKLALLIIDAAGNSTLVVEEITSPVPVYTTAELAIESVEFTTTAATINVSGLEGLELKKAVAYLVSTDANSYYLKSEADLKDLALSTNWMYRQLEDFTNGIVYDAANLKTADYNTELVPGKTYRVALGLVFADGSISNTLFGEFTYPAEEQPEEPGDESVVFTSAYIDGDYYDMSVVLTNGETAIVLNFYECTSSNYLPARLYDVMGAAGGIYTGQWSYVYDYATQTRQNLWGGQVVVSEVNGNYRFDVDVTCGDTNAQFKAVYEGPVTGLVVPSEWVAPEPEPEPEPVGFAPVRAEYDLMFDLYEYNGGDGEYAFWLYDENNNYIEVICHVGPHTNWDYIYEATKVIDGVSVKATEVQTQAPSDYECEAGEKHFRVVATFADDTAVQIIVSIPAVEVNYLGEGSTYAPGSENPGVGGGDGGDGGEVVDLTIYRVKVSPQPSYGETEAFFFFENDTDAYHRICFTECPLTAGVKTSFTSGFSSIEGKGSGQVASINIEVSVNADNRYVFIGSITDKDGVTYNIDTTNAEHVY